MNVLPSMRGAPWTHARNAVTTRSAGTMRGRAESDRRGRVALLLHVEDPSAVRAALALHQHRDTEAAEAARTRDAQRAVDDLERALVRAILVGQAGDVRLEALPAPRRTTSARQVRVARTADEVALARP